MDTLEDCLANAHPSLGALDESIAEYTRVLSINSHYPLAHYHLAVAYERKGERELAASEYKHFLEAWNKADQDVPEVIAARTNLGPIAAISPAVRPTSPPSAN